MLDSFVDMLKAARDLPTDKVVVLGLVLLGALTIVKGQAQQNGH
jgi:hypothetical protein